jgi:hypothetical protein
MKNINDYKNRFNNLLESELGSVKPIVEALVSSGSGDMDSITWLKKRYPNGIPMTIPIKSSGKNTFSNGIDKINPNDPKIKEISELIKNLLATNTGKIDVTVNGGASAVGKSQGYDNTALATRRRDNLINYLRQTFNTKSLNLIPGTVKEGQETTKNSDAAMKEQYVSVEVSAPQKLNVQIKGEVGDNTTRDRTIYPKNNGDGGIDPDPLDPTVKYDLKICVTIPKGLESQYVKLIRQFKNQYDLVKMGISKKTI